MLTVCTHQYNKLIIENSLGIFEFFCDILFNKNKLCITIIVFGLKCLFISMKKRVTRTEVIKFKRIAQNFVRM